VARNAVLGGGALGLTVALRLAQRGEHVVLYEREAMPGGLASGFQVGRAYLEKFYHHLFRSDKAAIALIDELGLADRLVWPRPRTSTLIRGKRYQLDSPQSVLRFSAVPFLDRLRLGLATAYLRLERDYRRLEDVTADSWLRKWMGRRVYETLWLPVLKGKFGDRYSDITMSWMWARIHLRSSSLGYLRGGFQQLYDALVRGIERLGGEVHFQCAVTGVEQTGDGRLVVRTLHDEQVFDRVISTLPTRLTIDLAPALQGEFSKRYGTLEFYGAHCLVLSLDRPLTDVYWLNMCDPGFPFVGLFEHTNYMPPSDYDGRHIVYLGNYAPMSDRLFRETDGETMARFLPALRRINPHFDESWVQEHWIYKAPYAQPIVSLGYRKRLPGHSTPIPNLFLANMSQVYPQDRGQNYSIAMANELVDELLDD